VVRWERGAVVVAVRELKQDERAGRLRACEKICYV
jgi:hypothetical protein